MNLLLRWVAIVLGPFSPSAGRNCCRRVWWACCSCSADRRTAVWRRRSRTPKRTAWPNVRREPRPKPRKLFSYLQTKSWRINDIIIYNILYSRGLNWTARTYLNDNDRLTIFYFFRVLVFKRVLVTNSLPKKYNLNPFTGNFDVWK